MGPGNGVRGFMCFGLGNVGLGFSEHPFPFFWAGGGGGGGGGRGAPSDTSFCKQGFLSALDLLTERPQQGAHLRFDDSELKP